jgi:hypothetical protein
MTPEYETWGQVLEFAVPDRSCRSVGSIRVAMTGSADDPPPRRRPRRQNADKPSGSILSAGPDQPPAVSGSDLSGAPGASAPAHPVAASKSGPAASAEPSTPSDRRMVDRQMQASLGMHLRAMFDHVAQEPVPDRFLALLESLESKEKER